MQGKRLVNMQRGINIVKIGGKVVKGVLGLCFYPT